MSSQISTLSTYSMARLIFFLNHKENLTSSLPSDGIPIRASDDVDGDEGEELQYEWSTEGEREIEPGREAPQVADQVDFMISSCEVKLSSICYQIIATGSSTSSRS